MELSTTPTDREPIKLGIAPGRRSGETPIDALVHTEQIAGRQFDVVRVYAFWDSEFPDLRHRFASEGGRMLHLSVNARREDGSVLPWVTIATAPPGDPVHDELLGWIDRLAAFDAPLRVTFHHEADIEPEFGSPAEFIAAWQRFSTLLEEAAPGVETVWVVTGFTLARPEADVFWPGDDYVDIIGADAFNWFGCRGDNEAWRSPAEVLAPLISFGEKHPGKPLVLAELGSDEDSADTNRKAQWLDELAVLVTNAAYAQLETVVFFHNDHDAESSCDWWVDSGDATAAAVARIAALPIFGGDTASPPPPAPCPVIATQSTSVDDLALVDGDGDGRFDFEFGKENRFLGIGDQSNDGADHRMLLYFEPFAPLPAGTTVELRLAVGERQPSIASAVQLVALEGSPGGSDGFGLPGTMLEPALFDAETAGGHYVTDLSGRVDATQPVTLRLQLEAPPSNDDGKAALFIGTGDAPRSIDRPTLIARNCP